MKKVLKNNIFLFQYIKKYAYAYIPLIFISAIFQALSSVANVLGIKYVIEAIEVKDASYCICVILIYCFVNLLAKGYFQWTNYCFPLLAKKVSIGMTIERMSSSQKLDFQCFDIPEYYDAYARALKSGEQQVSILVGSSIAMISNVTTLISISAIVANSSLWFLGIAILETIISYVLVERQNKLSYDYNHDNVRINRKEAYYKGLCFSPSVQIEDRLFGIIDYAKIKYKEISLRQFDIQKDYLKKYNFSGFGQVASSVFLLLIYMLIAMCLVNRGKMSIGEFVAMLSGLQSLSSQLLSLLIQFPKLVQNSYYIDDYKRIANYRPKIEKITTNGRDNDLFGVTKKHTIEFRNVSFKYPTCNKFVIDNVSFSIKAGQRIAIVGENGAGKTTIIKLMLRLYEPTEGEILFDGLNIKAIPISSWRKQFTSVFQDCNLYNFSLQENIWFGAIGDTGLQLKKVGLSNRFGISDWNRTISKQFDDDGIMLSGGEKQRLCIARALGKEAAVILLDEPSAALDPIIEDEVMKILFRETMNKTMLIITHKLSMCTSADEIICLDKGKIIEQGNHIQLIEKQGKYYDMFTMQAQKYSLKEE